MKCRKCGRPIGHRMKGICLACRYRETQKKDIPKIRKRQPKQKTCVVCGKDFTTKTRTITCSKECRRVYRLESQRQYAREHHEHTGFREKTCLTCGKVFKPTNPRNVYCSKECLETARKKKREKKKAEPKPVAERACSNCGKSFVPSHPRVRYCSDECRHAAELKMQRKYTAAYRSRLKTMETEAIPAPKPIARDKKPELVFEGPAPKARIKVNASRLPKPYLRYIKPSDMRMEPQEGRTVATVKKIGYRLAEREIIEIGKAGPSVYTEEDMQTIREMYKAGATNTMIGDKLGKNPAAIRAKIARMIKDGQLTG